MPKPLSDDFVAFLGADSIVSPDEYDARMVEADRQFHAIRDRFRAARDGGVFAQVRWFALHAYVDVQTLLRWMKHERRLNRQYFLEIHRQIGTPVKPDERQPSVH